MTLLLLFWEFFKTGLFAVGGGLATIPFLYDMSDRMGWFSHSDIADMVAISESTPGPIGVNMATYAGFRTEGIIGSITATLGLITPSIIVILIVAAILSRFEKSKLVQDAFYGLKAASAALITCAMISVAKIAFFDSSVPSALSFLPGAAKWIAVALGILLLVLTNIKKLAKLHPVVFLAVGAIAGILFKL